MEKIKLLLYCTKSKPILMKQNNNRCYLKRELEFINMTDLELNGKIVAECDFEVEEISNVKDVYDDDYIYETPTFNYDELLKKSCLNNNQLEDYLEFNGYAIHIKNLNIFDKSKELREYATRKPKTYETMTCDSCMENIDCTQCSYNYEYQEVMKAPQNMMKVCEWDLKDYILISIRPKWLCKILNGEKTIEVRKKVLKEMIPGG